jgi:hypothetical protein
MMYQLSTRKRAVTVRLHLETLKPENIRIMAFDRSRPDTYYVNRGGQVRGKRVFELPLPQSPDKLDVFVYNAANGPQSRDDSFRVTNVDIVPVKTYQLWLKDKDKEFIDFAQAFADNAGHLQPGVYGSDTGKFKIRYYDIIRDHKTGRPIGTPARISNSTGVIEVAKNAFAKYTVPMRMAILFHEYAHYNVNDDMTSEIQADLNGLYFYLGLGYPRIEAHKAFLTVFSNADTAQNEQRYQVIKNYIYKFDKGRIVEPNKLTSKMLAA